MSFNNLRSEWMTEEHKMLKEMTAQFIAEKWSPKFEKWQKKDEMDRRTTLRVEWLIIREQIGFGFVKILKNNFNQVQERYR